MSKISVFLSAVGIVLWGCASAPHDKGRGSGFAAREASAPRPADPEMLADLDVAVDSVAALFEFGDIADFLSARDSLRATIESLSSSFPEMRTDPQFQSVLKNLANLDSMYALQPEAHAHLAETDSLALAVQQWPENDTTRTITVSVDGDTVFPTISNDRIDFWIRYFTGPGKERFERTLYRMQLHRPTVEPILAELGLPPELICVAMIESGFNLKARSRARAVGPWQFIAGTGRIYGLRVNWWYDERRDIVASTYAAGNYLKDLYGIWNSWPLALAAYNCGEYRVARAVAANKTTDFWKLRLPKQTERYVPKFLATLYILRDPQQYGFAIPDVESIKFDEVTISDATDVKLIAQSSGTTVDVIRDLNPALLQWATPPKWEVVVKVPHGTGMSADLALANIPDEERVTWRKHRIREGETLSSISQHYGTTISALKRLNGIHNAHRIRAGTYLIVPVHGSMTEVASTKPQYTNSRRNINRESLEKYAARYTPPPGYKRVVYRVKPGDTLGEIAEEMFNTRASKLRAWNNLSYRSYIYAGQQLIVYVPESFDVAQVAAPVEAKPDLDAYTVRRYTVRKGDSMYSISRKFKVNMTDLLAWNNKSMRSKIYPGQTIDVWQKKADQN